MEIIEWSKFIVGAIFMVCGLIIFVIEMIGVFKFKYVLNRMHAAALGDTLGIALCILGIIIMWGFNFTSLKLFCIILFLWISSPVSSHLIARLEVTTNADKEKHYTTTNLSAIEKEGE